MFVCGDGKWELRGGVFEERRGGRWALCDGEVTRGEVNTYTPLYYIQYNPRVGQSLFCLVGGFFFLFLFFLLFFSSKGDG